MSIDDVFEGFSFGISEQIRQKFLKLLKLEIEKSKRILGAIIVTDEGLPIAYYPEELFSDKVGVSPSLAVIESTVERSIKELLDGDLDYITIATRKHILMIKSAGNSFIVSIISEKGISTGILYKKITKIVKNINEVLS